MRILHVIHTLDPRMGGPVESVKQLGQFFVADQHPFEVVAAADLPDDGWVGKFPVTVHALGPAYGKFAYSPRLRKWLNKHMALYDVVVINGLWQAHTALAASIARKLGVPYFIYVHGLLDPWNRSAHPVRYLKKLLYWAVVERVSIRGAQGMIFTTLEESQLAERYLPASGWKPVVAGSGIARPLPIPARACNDLVRRFPQLQDRRVWLFLSRIHPKKGLEILAEILPRLSELPDPPLLMIAGDGDAKYRRKIEGAFADSANVLWAGPLYGSEKWAAFRAAELFVLPSHQENFGIALVEALACGLPVLTTRAVNIWNEIQGYGAGIICDDSVPSVEEGLGKWIRMTAVERAEMSRLATKCYEERFEIGIAASRLRRAMEDVVSPRSPA